MMRLLLISSSTVHGYGYLDQPEPEIRSFLGEAKHVAFVPFAIHDRDAYAAKVRERLGRMGFEVSQVRGPADLEKAEAVFVGGGNTFRLLKALYETKTLEAIQRRVREGMPYMGASAGSNVAGPNILTTNDWNVVALDRFDALGLVGFNINPHYKEADPLMAAFSETRDDRIREYHVVNANPVVGLEEGSWVVVEDGVTTTRGTARVKLFRRGAEPVWFDSGARLPVS